MRSFDDPGGEELKTAIGILVALGLLGGIASAGVSHYSRQEVAVTFDGKSVEMTISFNLLISDDVNPQDYSMQRVGVPLFGKLKNALITVKAREPKPRVFHKKNALVVSNRPPYALVSDAQYYAWDLGKIEPGCEIECRYEIEDPEGMGGSYIPMMAEIPVDTAIVTIAFPANKWRLKYSMDRGEPAFVDSTDKAVFTRYDLPARDKSLYKKAPRDFTPGIWYLFESKTDKQDISEWNDVYLWAREKMGDGVSILDSAKSVSVASSPDEILSAIDRQCHYVAIEIGKGSYVPDRSDDVWSRGYSDCKGLATLFINWMRAAGFDAWQVLVSADDDNYGNIDFPSPGMFNHMVAAYVTPAGDTAYQDLTAEFCPLGYLPTELYGSLAYPLRPDAKPIRLGALPKEPDTLAILVEGDMSPDGILVGTMNLKMKGRTALQWNYIHAYTRTIDKEKMLRSMLEQIMPTVVFRKIEEDSSQTDEVDVSGPINIRRFRIQRDSVNVFKPWNFEFLRANLESDTSRTWPTILKRNMLYEISFRVRLNEPLGTGPIADSTGQGYEEFSYSLMNNSHDDSLLVGLKLYLPSTILSPELFNSYIDERKELLREIENEVTFRRFK
jgi:hypothetical protein